MAQTLTYEKIVGTKFEKFVERLLRSNDYNFVRHNVEYYRSRNEYRQVDLEYFKILGLSESFVILEMKYTSNGKIRLDLRHGEKRKSGQLIRHIDNLVAEVEERKRFVRADKAIIATNRYFENDVHREARKYGISLWEKDYLEELNKRGKGIMSKLFSDYKGIESDIHNIQLSKYDFAKKVVKIH